MHQLQTRSADHHLRLARSRLLALRSKIAGDRFLAALDRHAALAAKANFNPAQPRVPGPGPDAGQWIRTEGYAQERKSDPSVILAASPGIGHNKGPALDEPPNIPKQDPGDPKSRLQKAKDAAKWLAAFGARRIPVVAGVLVAIEAAQWLRSDWPSIRSYQDAPKTYDELVKGAREAQPGYHKHHVVEQTSAEREGFPRSMIDGVDNVVSVPIYKHRRISGWYQTPNADFGGLSPRDYLRGKDWSERVLVGREALKKGGGAQAMTTGLLSNLSLQQLVERFEALCVAQYVSIEREEIAAYSRRFKQVSAVIGELKTRPGDQRRLLQRFFSHGNNQVRITAARANLAIDYDRARAVFNDVAENDFGAQKLDAGMTLWNLDRGIYQPT